MSQAPDIIDDSRPSKCWPEEGRIEFDRYSTRYREGLDLVLRDISFDIPGGQKVSQVTPQQESCLTASGWYCWAYWSWQVITSTCTIPYH